MMKNIEVQKCSKKSSVRTKAKRIAPLSYRVFICKHRNLRAYLALQMAQLVRNRSDSAASSSAEYAEDMFF